MRLVLQRRPRNEFPDNDRDARDARTLRAAGDYWEAGINCQSLAGRERSERRRYVNVEIVRLGVDQGVGQGVVVGLDSNRTQSRYLATAVS